MEQYKEGQYDDDLTVGIDDYDEDFDTGDLDLFEYIGDDESPLARLKSIILSIDWEITDDILRQFNDELIDLKDIWAGNKINLIYIQALEKLSRYIYKEKASAHPNAIKLLLTFYTNLERIVSSDTLTEEETKRILKEDVARFEKLKKQITVPQEKQTEEIPSTPVIPKETVKPIPEKKPTVDTDQSTPETSGGDPLLNLKAIVYGIDWEITERDLTNLSREVKSLSTIYKNSKAKIIFLQGIGSIGAYINLKRSDAHADAFKLLHSFFVGLETVVKKKLSGQAEKDILFPLVEKFNTFKSAIADTITPESIARSSESQDDDDDFEDGELQPAFADVPEDVKGFQEDDAMSSIIEQEKEKLESGDVDEYIDKEAIESESDEEELAGEMESRLDGLFTEPDESEIQKLDANVALKGVDVETEADDDSDEEPLPEQDGELAPALAVDGDFSTADESPAVFADQVEDFFGEEEVIEEKAFGESIPGVDVETEADDDSDEEPLPQEDGEIAPALAFEDSSDGEFIDQDLPENLDLVDSKVEDFFTDDEASQEDGIAGDESIVPETFDEEDTILSAEEPPETEESIIQDKVEDTLDQFFPEEDEIEVGAVEEALSGVDVEDEEDEEEFKEDQEELLLSDEEQIVPASVDEELLAVKDPLAEDDVEDTDEFLLDIEPDEEIGEDEEELAVEQEIDESDINAFFDDQDTSTDDIPADQTEFVSEEIGDQIEDADADDFVVDEDILIDEELEKDKAVDESIEEPALFDDVDDSDDQHFAGLEEDSDIEAESFEDALLGVDVETEADDDSEEEPLPFEDGELAPALALHTDEATVEDDFGLQDEAENEVAEKFDTFFGSDDDATLAETPLLDIEAELDEAPVSEDSIEADSFEEVGFEEIDDEDIEELTEEDLAAEPIYGEHDDATLEDTPLYTDEGIESSDDELVSYLEGEQQPEADTDIADDELTPALSADDEFVPALMESDDSFDPDGDEILDGIEDLPEEEVEALLTGETPSGYPIGGGIATVTGAVAGVAAVTSLSKSEEAPITHPEDNEDFIVGIIEDDEEEEVIFEAVDESDLFGGGLRKDDEITEEFKELDAFGTVLLTEDDDVSSPVDEAVVGGMDSAADAEQFGDIQTEEQQIEEPGVYIGESITDDDRLTGLRECIASLGLEIEDDIIDSLNNELDTLNQTWHDKPIEKTFLQLITTVSSHIDVHRFDADPEANALLLSVFDKLELCTRESEDTVLHEYLLNETTRVLQWQQKLIDRKNIELISEPALEEEPMDIAFESTADADSDFLGVAGEGADFDISVPSQEEPDAPEVEKVDSNLTEGTDIEGIVQTMRDEMKEIKASLLQEIIEIKEDLRNERNKE